MLIEPNANNSITIITRINNIAYQISDSDEMGISIVRADHKDIEVKFADSQSLGNKPIGSNFVLYLK